MAKVANILFPADYFDKTQPNSVMKAEYDAALANSQLETLLFDFEAFETSRTLRLSRQPKNPHLPLLYRGWMMKPEEYNTFYFSLTNAGLKPLTQPECYDRFHLFPLAYNCHEQIRCASPKMLAFKKSDINAGIINETFDSFMIKDYVKSVKGTSFPKRFETPISQEDLNKAIQRFINLRGDLFTEGIVFKEFVDLKKYAANTNEWRAFYLNGKLLSLCKNSHQPNNAPGPPKHLVQICAGLESPYYTIDFAECANGDWIIVETGDG